MLGLWNLSTDLSCSLAQQGGIARISLLLACSSLGRRLQQPCFASLSFTWLLSLFIEPLRGLSTAQLSGAQRAVLVSRRGAAATCVIAAVTPYSDTFPAYY